MDDRERMTRIIRMYHANQDAARAMGISAGHLIRRCRVLGLPTPSEAHRRRTEREALA